jgi:hypothetical protein
MSDEELLWAASFQPRRPGPRRPSAPGKVAFMFLTRGPLPLAPLWERFFNATGGRELFSVYVHTTPGYRLDFPPSSPFHRRQVPSKVRTAHLGSSVFRSKFASFFLSSLSEGGPSIRIRRMTGVHVFDSLSHSGLTDTHDKCCYRVRGVPRKRG